MTSLWKHIQDCIKKSSHQKERALANSGKGCRGVMVTFLSKTTVNLILQLINYKIKSRMSSEIKKRSIFTVQLDSTQDASAKDQVSIILRYVGYDYLVTEPLFSLLDAEKSPGEYYLQLLKDALQREEIDTSNCICDATDGASNMQGIYNGFSTLLKKELPTHVYTWYYAYILSLVMGDLAGNVRQSKKLFKQLNDTAVF